MWRSSRPLPSAQRPEPGLTGLMRPGHGPPHPARKLSSRLIGSAGFIVPSSRVHPTTGKNKHWGAYYR